jgi:pimeloyl-ACP methyl ester carboxylesterase
VDGLSTALNHRVLASNPEVNVLHRGFLACDRYTRGLDAVAELSAKLLFVLGEQDQMTPAKAAQALIQKARELGKSVEVVMVPVGHHQMNEAPDATLKALRAFLRG